MPKRSIDWNENLAKELKDPEFAQGFIEELLSEGDSLQEALGRAIRAYGVKEFAKKVKMEPPAVQRAIRPSSNPTKQTLEQLLKPFKVTLGIQKTG